MEGSLCCPTAGSLESLLQLSGISVLAESSSTTSGMSRSTGGARGSRSFSSSTGLLFFDFESTFELGSRHQGTITEMKDKSGIVSLPYGLEAICPYKHLKKADDLPFRIKTPGNP